MDPGERVSQEARKIEFEQTQEFIREGIQQRMGRVFRRGSFTQVIFDPMADRYVVSFHFVQEGKKFVSTAKLDHEVVYERSAKLDTWKGYLDAIAVILKSDLRRHLIDAGFKTIGDLYWQEEPPSRDKWDVPALGPEKVYEMGNARPFQIFYDEDRTFDQGLADQQRIEEQEAVASIKASIKRTLAEQAQAEAEQ